MLLGYARVSTQDQHLEPQLDALKADGVDGERIYTDKATGANSDRPGLIAVLKALRDGDTLVVVKLDRLARSMKHLIELGEAIQGKGAALRVLDAGIDTGTPVGRLTFHIIGTLAEFELALIRERTQAGLRAARERGRRGGRKKKLEGKTLDLARTLWNSPEFAAEDIAKQMKVSRRTLFRELGVRTVSEKEQI
ncbi:recombinase family protein [Azospirillum cavernae]|uniref:Recombinase family protein n=1 Tax=Azospirillum cavernae TaxID=2320860 RepID=A0A418W3G0_9PROT|nr:recombinase family protein [Azospirillum cavernae]RJF84562.1 recombinase family protein [Azospirillum cavernae]